MALKNENAIVPVTRTNRTTLAAAKEVIDDGAAGPSAAGPSKPVATKATTGVLGTRKRAALGDLTNAHRAKSTSAAPTGLKDDVKGKTVVKEAVRSRSATTSSRGKSAEIASAAGAPKRVVHAQDDAMAVDENAPQGDEARPVKNSRRVASQSTTSRTRHSSTSAVSTTSTSARRATASSRTTTKQAAGKSTHVGSSRTSVKAEPGLEEDEEVQAEAREHKRVKTEQAAETQVGPAKDEGWEDLDKEDADDPLMVSEYVNEIFDYMKTIEVSSRQRQPSLCALGS